MTAETSPSITKTCPRCRVGKDVASSFTVDRARPGGLSYYCRSCHESMRAAIRARRVPVASKQCKRCGATKSTEHFHRAATNTDGLRARCKDCQREIEGRRQQPQVIDGNKPCPHCREMKPLGEFPRAQRSKHGVSSWCKPCCQEWRESRRGDANAAERYRLYGVTAIDYARMVAAQGGHCACCGGDPTSRGLYVDHDHDTGDVRALLCHHCNAGLGAFRDNSERLALGISYLKRFGR